MAKLILKEVTALCGGKFKKVNILIEKGIISRITTRPLDLFDAEVIEGGFAVSGYVYSKISAVSGSSWPFPAEKACS